MVGATQGFKRNLLDKVQGTSDFVNIFQIGAQVVEFLDGFPEMDGPTRKSHALDIIMDVINLTSLKSHFTEAYVDGMIEVMLALAKNVYKVNEAAGKCAACSKDLWAKLKAWWSKDKAEATRSKARALPSHEHQMIMDRTVRFQRDLIAEWNGAKGLGGFFHFCARVLEFMDQYPELDGATRKEKAMSIIMQIVQSTPMRDHFTEAYVDSMIETMIDITKNVYQIHEASTKCVRICSK